MILLKKAFPRESILTAEQILRLANIFDNAGQVSLGVMVFSPLIASLDKISPFVIVSGIIITIFCWWLSLYLTKRAK